MAIAVKEAEYIIPERTAVLNTLKTDEIYKCL